jgi:hypothetical protein
MSRSRATMAIAGSVFGGRAAAIPRGALLPGWLGAGSSGNQEKKPPVGGASPAFFRREAGHCLLLHG